MISSSSISSLINIPVTCLCSCTWHLKKHCLLGWSHIMDDTSLLILVLAGYQSWRWKSCYWTSSFSDERKYICLMDQTIKTCLMMVKFHYTEALERWGLACKQENVVMFKSCIFPWIYLFSFYFVSLFYLVNSFFHFLFQKEKKQKFWIFCFLLYFPLTSGFFFPVSVSKEPLWLSIFMQPKHPALHLYEGSWK